MNPARPAARPRSFIAAGIFVGLAVLVGTGPGLTAPASAPPVRLTFVSHAWTDDDFTLIEDAANGIERFKSAAGTTVVTRWIPLDRMSPSEAGRTSVYTEILRAMRGAARSSDLVIAWGDLLTGTVLAVAREYPRVRFGLVSSVYVTDLPPNVAEGSFRDEEETFLAGAAAAMASRSQTVGYIGSHQSDPRRIGFEAGVFYANPNVRVIVDHVGFQATMNWSDPARIDSWIAAGSFEPSAHDARMAQEVALAQYARGADVIYAHAGGSDAGVYEAAAARHRWVIGSGGARTEGTLPARWRHQILAVISTHPEHATFDLASRLRSGRALTRTRHMSWGLTYPGPPLVMIDYTATKPQFAPIAPYATALIREIGSRHVKVPYNQPGLAAFMKEFSR